MQKFIDGKITYEYHVESARDRLKKYGYNNIDNCITEGFNIMEYINSIQGNVLYKVNVGTLEIVVIDGDHVYYDFITLMQYINNYKIGTGYYWKQRLKKDDDRIGKRKIYKSNKGEYFIENGRRCYLNEYINR